MYVNVCMFLLVFMWVLLQWLSFTSHSGGNQVDGLPPARNMLAASNNSKNCQKLPIFADPSDGQILLHQYVEPAVNRQPGFRRGTRRAESTKRNRKQMASTRKIQAKHRSHQHDDNEDTAAPKTPTAQPTKERWEKQQSPPEGQASPAQPSQGKARTAQEEPASPANQASLPT